MSIIIVKNEETGEYVTVSKTQSDPENPKGYFRVEEKTVSRTADGWRSTVTKSMLFKGLVVELLQDVKDMNFTMTGKLYIEEIVESDLDSRADLKKRILSKALRQIPIAELVGDDADAYENAVAGSVKLSGKDGIELTHKGERILRFTSYDPTSTKQDTLVAYDNFQELADFQKEQDFQEAQLPAGTTATPASAPAPARTTRATTK